MMPGNKLQILIAEDDPVSLKVIHSIFKDYGECELAANGEEALQIFLNAWSQGRRFDLICLDIMMPKMSGHEVLKAVREHETTCNGSHPPARIIMITALKDEDHFLRAYNAGSEWYITKPIDRKRVHEVLIDIGIIEG